MIARNAGHAKIWDVCIIQKIISLKGGKMTYNLKEVFEEDALEVKKCKRTQGFAFISAGTGKCIEGDGKNECCQCKYKP